jgi:hypothetical protein
MKTRLLVVLGHLFALMCYGQSEEEPVAAKPQRFFPTFGITVLFEGIYEEAWVDTLVRYNNPSSSDTTIIHETNSSITLVSVTFDPRVNLIDFNDQMSLSMNFPIEFAFNAWQSDGLFTFVVPAMLDFNYGCHSTYNNIDRWGGHIGLGYQMVTGPIFFRRSYDHMYYQPVMRIGVKGPLRKNKNCYMDFYWGFGKFYNNVQPNYVPHDNKIAPSKLYAKIVFGWLLNYD